MAWRWSTGGGVAGRRGSFPELAVKHISTFHLDQRRLGFHVFSGELDGINQKQAQFVRSEAPMMVGVKSVVANLSRENTGFITLV